MLIIDVLLDMGGMNEGCRVQAGVEAELQEGGKHCHFYMGQKA